MNQSTLPEGVDMYMSNGLLPLYYLVVVLSMIYVLHKFKYDKIVIFFVLIYTEGFMSYVGYQLPVFNRVYKLFFLFFTIYLFLFPLLKQRFNLYKAIYVALILVATIFFFANGYINHQEFAITFSQYQKRLIPFLFLFGMIPYIKRRFNFYMSALLWIIGVQFIFALFKLVIWGFGESLVGSISFNGGGPSNVLPIVAFFLIWLKSEGNLTSKDWGYLLLVFSVSIIGDKRSIIFTFPLFVFITMVISGKLRANHILKFSVVGLFCLYIAVKLNPSLNPEHTRWGSFDPGFVIEYATEYTFGDKKNSNSDEVQGRGASSQVLLAKIFSVLDFNDVRLYMGEGFSKVDVSYEDFEGNKYGITSKGSASGFVQSFIAYGIIGTILFLILGYMNISILRDSAVKWASFIFIVWDFLFFYFTSMNVYAFTITIIFAGIYSYKPKRVKNNRQLGYA